MSEQLQPPGSVRPGFNASLDTETAAAPLRTDQFEVLCLVRAAFPQWSQRHQIAFWLSLPETYFLLDDHQLEQ